MHMFLLLRGMSCLCSFCCWEQGEKDDKIIAVCADDPEYKHYTDIKELPPHRLAEIRRFFEDCILIIKPIFRIICTRQLILLIISRQTIISYFYNLMIYNFLCSYSHKYLSLFGIA